MFTVTAGALSRNARFSRVTRPFIETLSFTDPLLLKGRLINFINKSKLY